MAISQRFLITLAAASLVSGALLGSPRPALAAASGLVYGWGDNSYQQLAMNTAPNAPAESDPGHGGVTTTATAVGATFSLALDPTGVIHSFGANDLGTLGDTTFTSSSSAKRTTTVHLPVGVTATAIAAGGVFAMALGSDGKVYTWGYDANGQLGNGTTTGGGVGTPTPAAVPMPNLASVKAIAAGNDFAVALDVNNNLFSWGHNSLGQLGNSHDATTDANPDKNSPVNVTVLPGGVTPVQMSAGNSHVLVLGSDQQVYGWGANNSDNLGLGFKSSSGCYCVNHATLIPGPNPALPAGVHAIAVSAGGYHSLFLMSNGAVYSCGPGGFGQLGNGVSGSTPDRPQMAPVIAAPNTTLPAFTKIAATAQNSYALGADNKIYSWGNNVYGALGNGTSGGEASNPVQATSPGVGLFPIIFGVGSSANSMLVPFSNGAPTRSAVSRFAARHAATSVTFGWHVTSNTGIVGFTISAGKHALSAHLIPVHAGHSYHYTSRTTARGPYVLHTVLTSGRQLLSVIR